MEIFGLICMVNVGIRYVPGTQMTSIFEGTQPLQNKAFSNQNKGHLGSTRWAPNSYKWSYNPYKWPYKWVNGVISLLIGVITSLITRLGAHLAGIYSFFYGAFGKGSNISPSKPHWDHPHQAIPPPPPWRIIPSSIMATLRETLLKVKLLVGHM